MSNADDTHTVVRKLLQLCCRDNPEREGLLETPARVAKAWAFWSRGIGQNPASILKTFEDGAEGYDQMIVVSGIPVYSQCEHHLAPFWGEAHVAYIPDKRIVGLSKFARLVDCFARRLQVQERVTSQVAAAIEEHLKPRGVGVILRCRHMCMESRGVQAPGTLTITSALHGVIRDDQATRQEFLALKGYTKGVI